MVHATYTALNQAPKAFDGVGVNVAHDVDASGVIDAPMLVAPSFGDCVVPAAFIGEHSALGENMNLDRRNNGLGLHVVHYQRTNAALALDHAEDRLLVIEPQSVSPALSAEVCFIDFNIPAKRLGFSQQRADLI